MDSESTSSRMLRRLHRSHMRDACLDEVFIVLSVGASLIATLGLLADSAAVVIGAMVVAPWIMPLRAAAFAILLGEVQLLGRSLQTLSVGVISTTVLSLVLGTVADLPRFGSEVPTRTTPNLLDLGIALVAGGLATYAKLRSDAVSSWQEQRLPWPCSTVCVWVCFFRSNSGTGRQVLDCCSQPTFSAS